jgi:molybdate transport system regulatory protein
MEFKVSSPKWSKIKLIFNFSIYNETGQMVISDSKLQLLMAINDYGTLSEAAKVLNISYRKAWGDLKKIEKLLGITLLVRFRGGPDGGFTTLTDDGKLLVKASREMLSEHNAAVNEMVKKFKRTLRQN